MDYREVVQINLKQAIRRRDSTKDKKESQRWSWVIENLTADLRNFEEGGVWLNSLAVNHPKNVAFLTMGIDDIFRMFFRV